MIDIRPLTRTVFI